MVLMIEYEVNLEIDAAIDAEYLPWLLEHIDQMLALPGFIDAGLKRILEPVAPGRIGYCVRYRLRDREALEVYLGAHAARMRELGVQRFGDRLRAERRVLVTVPNAPGDRSQG